MANEQLRSMLNNLINEKSTEATLDFHQYITEQVKSIVGLSEGAKNIDAFYKIMYNIFDENDHELVSIRSIEIKDGKIVARLEQNDAGVDFMLTLAMTDSGKISVTGKGTGGLKVDFEIAASKAGLNTLFGKLSDMAEKLDESAGSNSRLMDKEVKILSGKYQGKTGHVDRIIGDDEVEVQIDDFNNDSTEWVKLKVKDIEILDESAETLNEWYEGDRVFDFVRAILDGDSDEMEEALRGSSLEKMLKKSGFSSVQEVKSAVKKIRGSKIPNGYEFSYHVNVDGHPITLVSKKKISGINAKVIDVKKLD